MSFKKSMVALAAITYGVGSVAASAAPLAPAVQPLAAESEFGNKSGDSSGTFLLVFALVAVIAGIVIAADGGDDEPLSP